MPRCLKCGAELQVNEEGVAPVLCDRCAGVATRRARVSMNTSTFRQYPATTALLAINIAVFLGMVLSGGFSGLFGHFDPRLTIVWGSNLGPATLGGQYWRLVTAGFVHAGILHIAFNMWCLWYVGQISERLFGRWITVAVYLLTGVGGSLLSVWVHPFVNEVGASGAIFGIAGAILTGIKFGNISIPDWQRRSLFSSLIFFVGFNLVLGSAIPGIDNWCHLGGLITGLIFGVPLATASASGKKSLEWATIVLSALVLAGIGARVVQAKRPPVSPFNQAIIALNQRDFPTAISHLEQITRDNPHDVRAQSLLGLAYEMNHQREKAIAAYQKALALAPGEPALQKKLDELRNSPD